MARYIDAERIDFSPLEDDFDRARAKVIIMGQPTADVVEVKHGHIVRNERNIAKMKEFHEKGIGLGISEKSIFWTCSECGSFIRPYDKFCPNCGAKMRGDTE